MGNGEWNGNGEWGSVVVVGRGARGFLTGIPGPGDLSGIDLISPVTSPFFG